MPTKKKPIKGSGDWTAAEKAESIAEAKMIYEMCNEEQQQYLQREARRLDMRVFNLILLHLQRSVDDRIADEKSQALLNEDVGG